MARTTAVRGASKGSSGKPGATRGGGGSFLTMAVIIITVLAVTALPICILVVAGMLPTAAAALVDRHPRRYLARTIGAVNLAGVAPGVLRLWESGTTFVALRQVIGSPYTWLLMYGAAAIGWALYSCVPSIVAMAIEIRDNDAKRRLEARAQALTEDWGPEVSGRSQG